MINSGREAQITKIIELTKIIERQARIIEVAKAALTDSNRYLVWTLIGPYGSSPSSTDHLKIMGVQEQALAEIEKIEGGG